MAAMPLLLVPGTLCDATLWSHQRAHLAEVAHVLVADGAACDTLAATAQAILRDAPSRFALAGLSLGGMLALEILRQAPQRVARLALLHTSARALAPEQAAHWAALEQQVADGGFAQIAATMLPPMLAARRQRDAALVAQVQRMAHAVGAEGFLRQVGMQRSRRDNRSLLPSITCPTLVLGGRQDAVCPLDRQHELVAALPHARLAVLERCGHLSPLEQPEAITALLREWLLD